ncbi:BadF/BadG/BcrA/BcrD ATPase family protein [Paraliomyxa miuraensis]|uniref:BadF/BadG/BcrA/BcrD ATPase family protein n=1 Tax=Paraliomyxa miuraensis TaxID=376150 RepID=UPI00225249AF|nr:BadF/BadG/BcrA/BcrD ATPase family protein [Paraliomyxa miuraensis]MCX4246879.1 acyl-CoA dehydratase activase-related protein [Paraliomyxa miuraensis]
MMSDRQFRIGFDLGSTTVKAVVVDVGSDEIVWKDYRRHDSKQPEKACEMLQDIERDVGVRAGNARMFITGSGGGNVGRLVGAKFVQEVNAVSMAVEKLHPEVNSVIELGGQDAKIIVFKPDPESGRKKKIPSMNDKCAGGTGAVIDKINAKLKLPPEQLCNARHTGLKLHPVAGKCGVFAETDINSLQKMGVPADELMASLFESIIQQNLSVLTRGHTLMPHVMLLGGPNTYIRGMQEAWRANIPPIWEEREVPLPPCDDPAELIIVPDNAQYYAALGAAEFGKDEDDVVGRYKGMDGLRWYIDVGRKEEKKKAGGHGLAKDDAELQAFKTKYQPEKFVPATFEAGTTVRAYVGIDGGSTSSKAVLLSEDAQILAKVYQLSKGNPIEDTKDLFADLQGQVAECGATLEILGVGTTGYAKDILKDVLRADAAIVETVAHCESALHFYDDVDVVCDVGGQDIKIIILKNGKVKDFKLNTQCSAGNGYFLQGTAAGFGYDVRQYADVAFAAESMPMFGYGCAVFMQSDIVDFQRQGWAPEEIMAGLANVLPKNIWLYVSQIPNLAKLGRRFVLQGGTQHNLAAVKSQVDFIQERFVSKGLEAEVIVHKHCGESGAIGAALEARRMHQRLGHQTQWIGLQKVPGIEYRQKRDESTRCYFCKNKCLRTFIDVDIELENDEAQTRMAGGELLQIRKHSEDTQMATKRLIIATCEKGEVEDVESMRKIKSGLDRAKKDYPNFAAIAAKDVWKAVKPPLVADDPAEVERGLGLPEAIELPPTLSKYQDKVSGLLKRINRSEKVAQLLEQAGDRVPGAQQVKARAEATRARAEKIRARGKLRIGIPRVLNQYSQNPFFSAYFEALGVKASNLIYSDYTSEEMYKEGAKRGAIDPCFPSKVCIAHMHNLLEVKHKKKPLDLIVFPQVDSMDTWLSSSVGARACPTVVGSADTTKAAFVKERDIFVDKGILHIVPFVHMREPKLCKRELLGYFGDVLGLSEEENARAVEEGYRAQERFVVELRKQGRQVLKQLEEDDRIGIVLLARPYHNDPGMNHEIPDELQKLGYPIFTIHSLPIDDDIVQPLFADDIEAGFIKDPFDIYDVWKNSYSENTNQKVWAAKYCARHPNLVALELSSFKCGHDAPIYTVIEEIVETSGTPYFSFKDIDENKPTGSIKIRTETIGYFLRRYQEDLRTDKPARGRVAEKMRQYQAELLAKIEAAQVRLGAEAAEKPDVLLDVAGLRSTAVDKRYRDLAHAKEVNASQAQTLNKTAGAHRGAEAPRPAEAPASAPAAKRSEP